MQNRKSKTDETSASNASSPQNEYLQAIEEAKHAKAEGTEHTYEERDVILYNLGVGAKRGELDFVYEGAEDFQALATFGVIPALSAQAPYELDSLVPNFNPVKLLHGEQYLEVRTYPIPTSGTLVSYPRLLEVVDKGGASIVKTGVLTLDKATGKEVFWNEITVFLRGSGGFGGVSAAADRGAATAENKVPDRSPDAVVETATSEEQAALYRLSGDYNPLHIDPNFAATAGFQTPILHGLCTLGLAAKAVAATYGRYSSIKVRFAGPVVPGQTLVTAMWKVDPPAATAAAADAAQARPKVLFQTTVKETGKLALGGAGVVLA